MTIIATAVRHLLAAGVTGEALIEAIADMEAAQPKDAAAEKRRAWDRERKRKAKASGGIPVEQVETTEGADDPALSRPPNENNSNPPTHTHPDVCETRARKADPFPKPDWAEAQHWADLKANRKAKRLPNTTTAHAKFLRDIAALADDDWPPGRLLEAIVARGWAAAYDPRENPNGRHTRQTDLRHPTDASRGERRNRCLDMVIAAETEDSEPHPELDWQTRPALRAIGQGGP